MAVEMAVEMVKLFLIGVSRASYLFSLAIFKGIALLLVTTLRILQFPGWTVNAVLILIRESIINTIKTIFDVPGQWFVSVVKTGVELITNAATTAVRSFTQELFCNATAEVYESASDKDAEIVSNFWEAVDILIKSSVDRMKNYFAHYMLSLDIFKGTSLLVSVLQYPGWAIHSVLILIRESIESVYKEAVDILIKSLVDRMKNYFASYIVSLAIFKGSALLLVTTLSVLILIKKRNPSKRFFWEAIDILIKYAANN